MKQLAIAIYLETEWQRMPQEHRNLYGGDAWYAKYWWLKHSEYLRTHMRQYFK